MADMTEKKVMNRWIVVVGAILIQLCLGAIYAWSAFTKKLTEDPFVFTKTQTQVILSVGLASFAVTMALFAGRWLKKAGPRFVAIIGGAVMGIGYMLGGVCNTPEWLDFARRMCSWFDPRFLGILLGVGVLGGAGIGLCYVCPIATLVKWFPDKKGMITGLAVAGFGFGALIWVKLTNGFVFGPFNLTPGWDGLYGMSLSVTEIFLVYGVVFFLVIALGASVLVNPPEGWKPAGWQPDAAKAASTGGVDFTEKQMVATGQFWILFLTFTAGAMAGLMVIGIIQLFGVDVLTAHGVEAAKATVITGTAMGLFYALLNGFGRIVWGAVSDGLGRKNSIVLMTAIQGVMMIIFYFIGNREWGLYLGAAVIGFNFGGNFALFPAATADLFGNKNLGTNYPWVFMAYGVGGIIGPVLGGAMGDAKAWMWAFIPAGVACLAVALLATQLRPPKHHSAA